MENETVNETVNEGVDSAVNNEVITLEEFERIKKRERSSGRLQGVLISLASVVILALFLLSGYLCVKTYIYGRTPDVKVLNNTSESKINALWRVINKYYLWDVDTEKAMDGMYKGLMNSLEDPYSCYYTKSEMDELLEDASGEYSGIGAYVSVDPESKIPYIARPMPDSPAEKAGVLAGDYIYEIDGEDVTGQDLNLVVSKIKGPDKTDVVLGLRREGESELINITVKRGKIEVAMLESRMLEDKIGYIWLYEFERPAVTQFNKAYDSLEKEGMKSLIIDLRSNPGGDFDAVVDLADEFLPEGTIVYTKNKNGSGDKRTSDAKCKNIPLVVLVDRNSASASEIFTGTLKDHEVATIVGENTFGKGIVQAVLTLPDGTGVKITESEYYLPNDECIHGVGIKPDVEVEFDGERYRKDGYDSQLEKAIEVIKTKMK
ncbi:MAG: S41 family peptidase [Lachnospiraceae bacterium]|nr:S41 family peptidase [Lachnospiraceae bacterium]